MSITLISEHQPGLITFLKSGESSSAVRSALHFKVMFNSSSGLDWACQWDQSLVTASGSPVALICPRRWRSLLSSSLREHRCDKHHITLHFINGLYGPHELLLGFTGGHRDLQPSLLQLPWFLHGGQLKPRAMVFLQCGCPGLPALEKALRDPLLVFKIGTKHRLDWAKLTAIAWHAACFPWKMLQTLLGQLSAHVTACQQPGLHTGWDVCP